MSLNLSEIRQEEINSTNPFKVSYNNSMGNIIFSELNKIVNKFNNVSEFIDDSDSDIWNNVTTTGVLASDSTFSVTVGEIIEGYVSYISGKDFYVIPNGQEFQLIKIENIIKMNKKSLIRDPYLDEVFGLFYNNRFVRATIERSFSNDCYASKVRLIDCGYLIESTNQIDYRPLELPQNLKELPPFAIHCRCFKDGIDFQKLLFKGIVIKVENIVGSISYVTFHTENHLNNVNSNNVFNSGTNDYDRDEQVGTIKLSSELPTLIAELENNLQMALFGYENNNSRYLCEFYDPLTEECFKGALCKKIHLPNMNGISRDLHKFCNDAVEDQIYPDVGKFITIVPTYFENCNRFYGHIQFKNEVYNNHKAHFFKHLCSSGEMCVKKVEKLPQEQTYVLIKNKKSNILYRALVIEVDSTLKIIHVFLVDFGGTVWVEINQVIPYDDMLNFFPPCAYKFKITNLEDTQLSKELKEKFKNKFETEYLMKSIRACVKYQDRDIIEISIYDHMGYDIVEEILVLNEFKSKLDY